MTNTDTARPAIGLKRLVMWPMVADTAEKLEYGEVHEFEKRLMTATNAPNVNQASLDADDQTVEELAEKSGGTITYDITDLTSEERVLIYGEKIKNGTNVSNIADIGSYVASAYMTTRADGKVNLKKIMKAKFAPQSETNSTKQKGSTTFATKQIVGNYIPTIHNGDLEYERRGVDPVADAEVIASWFTEATYIGPEETQTASTTDPENTDEAQG